MACNITRAFSSEAEGGEEKRSGRREGLTKDAGLEPGLGSNDISSTKSYYYGCLPSVGSSWRYL